VVEIDNDEDDGVDDGISEEGGDDDDDDDKNDDERDIADEDLPSPEKPPRIRRPLPPWLLGAFKTHVAGCEMRDAQGRPPLYASRSMKPCNTPGLLGYHSTATESTVSMFYLVL